MDADTRRDEPFCTIECPSVTFDALSLYAQKVCDWEKQSMLKASLLICLVNVYHIKGSCVKRDLADDDSIC